MQISDYRLLIVEDEEINRFVLEKILRTSGCSFIFAGTGEEALFQLQNGEFDLVLMDIELPGMNGYDTTTAIRSKSNPDSRTPLILAMTGHQHPEEKEKAIASGMNGWVVKPFGIDQLNAAIQNALDKKENTDQKTTPVINLELLNSIAGDDPDFVRMCIELFLKEMPTTLNQLNKAIEICDWETIRTTSHKMKTSLNYMGLGAQRLAAVSIEKLAREKRDMEKIKSDAQMITTACHRAFMELTETSNQHEQPKS